MSESVVINDAEKIGKTVATSLDPEKESVSMTEKCVIGLRQMPPLLNGSEDSSSPKQMSPTLNGSGESLSPKQMSPLLLNGSGKSLDKAKEGATVGFNEIELTQLPTKVTQNVSDVEELNLDPEINHANDEGDDSLKNSSSDVVSVKLTSAYSLSVLDCDSNKKDDLEELSDSPKSNTLKADDEPCSDTTSKQTNSTSCVDVVNNHSDMENCNGEDKFHKNLSKTASIDSSSAEADVNQKRSIKYSDISESSETTDLGSNIDEAENDFSPALMAENGNVTSHEDSAVVEKCDQPLSLMEAVEEEKTVAMPPTSELDTKVKNLSGILLKVQSPPAVDETQVASLKPSRESEMESEAVAVSIEPTREKETSNSCQDSVPQKSESDMKRVDETASYCSDIEDDIEEVKMDVNETLEGSDDKQVKSDLHYLKKSEEGEPMDEEDETKSMDLLKISKVESYTDVIEEMSETIKDGIEENSHVKPEAEGINGNGHVKPEAEGINENSHVKPEAEGIEENSHVKPVAEGINENSHVKPEAEKEVEKIDSKGDCKSVTEELKDLHDDSHPSEETVTVEEKNNIGQLREDQSTPVKKDGMVHVVEPDSAVKVSFKDILKKSDSFEKPKDTKQGETDNLNHDPEETIVIDEVETGRNTSTNLHAENEKAKESSRSEELQTETIGAKDEDILSNDGESTKKRSFDSSAEVSGTVSPKRQRLDHVIHKLGDHVGVKSSEATTVIMDSDDDSATSSQVSDKAAEEENKMETNGRIIKLSSEMLKNLIKASMRTFVKSQVLEKEQVINERMKKMEAAIDLWRETAKHLEKSVNELTSYTKEFRKCKSQSLKLKNLASRTVAVQVSLHQNQPKATASPNQNRSTSLSLPPSVLRHPAPTQTGPPPNRPMAQSNGNVRPSQPTTPRQFRPGGPRGVPAIPTGSQQPSRPKVPNMNQNTTMAQSQPSSSQQSHVTRPSANSQLVQQLGKTPITRPFYPTMAQASHSFQGSSSNMIDLTDEDDTSKQTTATPPASQRANRGSVPPPGQNFAHNSNIVRGSQAEPNIVNSSNNQIVRSAGPGPNDRHNASSKSLSGGPVQHVNNMRNVNGISMVASTSKSGVPVNSSGLTNGQAANKTSLNETSSKAPGTAGPGTSLSPRSLPPSVYVAQPTKHPAPLPVEPYTTMVNTTKVPPPKPSLKISRVAQGIVLSWNMPVIPANIATISSYQLFAYQETNSAPSPSLWKKVGDVKALPLPMACTLVQFQEGNKYYFAVRAIDQFGRWGEYSDPSSIYLFPK